MKTVPTDDECAESGYEDGGQLLLALRASPADDYAFRSQRPAEWNAPLRQPIWRCVHHLVAFLARVVELRVHGSTSAGDLRLSRREVGLFKAQGLGKGVDPRGQEADAEPKRGRGRASAPVAAPAPAPARESEIEELRTEEGRDASTAAPRATGSGTHSDPVKFDHVYRES